MKKKGLPTVVIVGRMNVGKSTLFNRLSTDVKAITLDYEGVTRDIISDTVCWKDYCFDLIDTGGISLRKTSNEILQKSREQALDYIKDASVVLFVCDGTVGILTEDREIANLLHKMKRPTVLLINKSDTKKTQEQLHEFNALGFDNTIPISAQHGINIHELFDAILAVIPKETKKIEEETTRCNVVILGKPNVGKSSLLNLLLKQERAIVADQPGTTREAITERVQFQKEHIQVTDTPGLRRKRGVTEPLEKLMVRSSLRSIDDAQVVVLMIDANEGEIVDQELKLAFFVFKEKNKALIILFNKDDLVTETKRDDLEYSLSPYEYFLKNITQVRISCKSKKNIGKLLATIDKVCARYKTKFSDQELTILFKEALMKKPLYRQGQLLRLYRVRQIRTAPITIELTVTHTPFWGPTQFGFLERMLRKAYDLKSVPVKFVARKRR